MQIAQATISRQIPFNVGTRYRQNQERICKAGDYIMTLTELLQALNSVSDYTKLGHLIKEPAAFTPETDAEYNAKLCWEKFLNTFFQNRYSAYITADTIKSILDASSEIYNPEKLERCAAFIRNKLRPAQIITDQWLIYFVRKFR